MKKRNVLSLFDGMSCGQIALNRAGIDYANYYASEIDEAAIKVAKANYPKAIHLGDVNNWRTWDIDFSKIDLLIGGSPCQGFSIAGKRLDFDDPRSELFFVYLDIWRQIKKQNPAARFFLENVKMRPLIEGKINKLLGVEARYINSKNDSPQARRRLYWFDFAYSAKEERSSAVISDILESSPTVKNRLNKINQIGGFKYGEFINGGGPYSQGNRVYDIAGKAPTLNAQSGGAAGRSSFLILEDNQVRKISILEAERLQGLPDNYTNVAGVTDAARRKMIGNGWQVQTVTNIFKRLNQ